MSTIDLVNISVTYLAILKNSVKHDGFALEHISHQTHEICLAAIANDSHVLKYIRSDAQILKYSDTQILEICLEAIKCDEIRKDIITRKLHRICISDVRYIDIYIDIIFIHERVR